jgi:hypothetical protein
MESNELEHEIISFYNELIKSKKGYLQLFSDLQIQREGWFSGELMNYFNDHVHKMAPENREVRVFYQGNKKYKVIDFRIDVNGQSCWIELKHILIGNQKKYNLRDSQEKRENKFPLKFYFNIKNPSSVAKDVAKLNELKLDPAFVLAFISVNNNYITSRDMLKEDLEKILKLENISAILKGWDFDYASSSGYFILKVGQENNQIS